MAITDCEILTKLNKETFDSGTIELTQLRTYTYREILQISGIRIPQDTVFFHVFDNRRPDFFSLDDTVSIDGNERTFNYYYQTNNYNVYIYVTYADGTYFTYDIAGAPLEKGRSYTFREILQSSGAEIPPNSEFSYLYGPHYIKYYNIDASTTIHADAYEISYYYASTDEGPRKTYIHTNGSWKIVTPYIFTNGQWKRVKPSIYSGGWK